jgi:hypothetical protein
MTHILSKEERTQIVNSHKKNLAMNKYNVEISLIEENAKTAPDSANISSLNTQASAIDLQMEALDDVIASIIAE